MTQRPTSNPNESRIPGPRECMSSPHQPHCVPPGVLCTCLSLYIMNIFFTLRFANGYW